MAKDIALWGPTLADTTLETVFTNVTGTCTILESITVAQPNGSAATVVVFNIGADAAGTRAIRLSIPAGEYFNTFYPNVKITGTTIIQQISTVTDDVCVTTGNGRVVAV